MRLIEKTAADVRCRSKSGARGSDEMKLAGVLLLMGAASLCCAQEPGDFQPAVTNVPDAQYPKVDSQSRAEIRVKAPDASKVKLNFWSGPKLDMEKQADGTWMVTTPPFGAGAALLHGDHRRRRGERPEQLRIFRRGQGYEHDRDPRGGSNVLHGAGGSARAGARGVVPLAGDGNVAACSGVHATGL